MSNRTKDDVDRLHDYGISLSTRTIMLGNHSSSEEGEITPEVAETFIKNLHLLSHTKDEITILINTPGGDVDSGMAIYDAINTCECFINAVIYKAESMGSVIVQACDKRMMMPHGKFMIHKGSLSLPSAHSNTAYKWIEQAKKDDKVIEDIWLKRIKEKKPKFTRSQLLQLIEHDKWFTPNQAIQYNFIDEIYGQ